MKERSRKALKITASILLVVCVLSCSFSVFAVDVIPTPEVTTAPWGDEVTIPANITESQLIYYIWATMNAWGIRVTVNQVEEFDETVENWLVEMIGRYLDGELSSTLTEWFRDWAFSYDDWGNFQGNSNFVEDMQDFVAWMIDLLNISDNSTITSSPVYKINGIVVYQFPLYTLQWGTTNYEISIQNGPQDKFVAIEENGSYLGLFLLSQTSFGATNFQSREVGTSRWYQGSYLAASVQTINNYDVSPWHVQHGDFNEVSFRSYSNYEHYTFQEIVTAINGQPITTSDAYEIVTGDIVLPDDNNQYQPGYSIIIYPDGSVAYLDINWPESINVGNLPAVIQVTRIENPEIDQFYDFIPSFIDEAGDSMNFFKQIIFRMPDEVLYCIYAVLASGVIFGFLRILREH